jgi:hypothetical protein
MQLILLRLLLLVVAELLEGFKGLVSTQKDLDLVEKEQPHRDGRFLNNNGVPLFLPVSVNRLLPFFEKYKEIKHKNMVSNF